MTQWPANFGLSPLEPDQDRAPSAEVSGYRACWRCSWRRRWKPCWRSSRRGWSANRGPRGGGPGGFFDFLFGPRPVRPPPQQEQQRQQRQRKAVQPRPQQPSEPPVAVAEVTPKDANARKILVIGDFVAGGLAWGLDQTFADEPKIAVLDESNNSSGLVRDGLLRLEQEAAGHPQREAAGLVVVALGANDRQQIRAGKNRLAVRSDAWEKTYDSRVAGMVDTLKVFGRPFFWVSAPPMRSSSASRDMDLSQRPRTSRW